MAFPINEVLTSMPTYCRTLGPNELSYFLPSRAYGLNDMFTRIVFHAPPDLITPIRIRTAWAIMRLRHTILACRVEMRPGEYDSAQLKYTPPTSPREAVQEAAASMSLHDKTLAGPALLNLLLNGPPILSAECIAHLDVAFYGSVPSAGDAIMHEFHLAFTSNHMICDSLAALQCVNDLLELLAGPASGARTDAELAAVLKAEWKERWGRVHTRVADEVIVPAVETRICRGAVSKFYDAAWRVDQQNIERRAIGGHVFPRVKTPTGTRAIRLVRAKFTAPHTAAFFAACKAQRVTPQNAVFALCNLAWIRMLSTHPELRSSDALPMLMYTAIGLRRRLGLDGGRGAPLELSLALGYHTVTLPTFVNSKSTDKDKRQLFWARARAAQKQIQAYTHSPLLPGRAVAAGMARASRAKRWARLDDGIPPIASMKGEIAAPPPAPALIGITQSGDVSHIFRTSCYPAIRIVDNIGNSRKGPGGVLLSSRTFQGRFSLALCWDAAARKEGVVEEFWRNLVDGFHEYALGDASLTSTAEEEDILTGRPLGTRTKL